jgi:gliding motility-associated-like protein
MSPDGKILVSTASENYIGAILKPNVYGTGCTFVPQYVTFPVTSTCELGLPNMVQSYYHSDSLSMKSSGNCSSKNVLFDIEHLNIYDSIRWDFGDPASGAANYSSIINPGHLFSANGFYTVTVLVYKSCKTDTLQKFISVGDTHTMLGIDTSICPNSTFTPRVTVSGASYEWQDGSTADSFKITGPGIYWVKIKLDNCISTDSLIVTGKPSPVFDLGNDRHICENSSVLLDLTGTGDSYLWQDNSTAPVYNVSKAGLYFVKVTKGSCSITDSVKISILLIPRPNLGPDISICRGAPVLLNPGTFEGSYLWQDGASTLTYSPTQSGSYSVTISNNCATGTDDINVVLSPCDVYIPNAFTPNEDGKNDEFKVAIYGTVNSFRLEVFNRYGALIFVSSDPSTGWDGWYKNKPQPSGAYTWHCVYQLQGKVLTEDKGTVLLVR